MMEAGRKEFDLCLLDLNMPETNGIELARRLRQKGYTSPLILLTSSVVSRDELGDLFFASASKPIRSSRLRQIVVAALVPEEGSKAHPPSSCSADAPSHPPLKILVAEDNIVNQRVVVRHLERLGYRPDVVANGKEVLEGLRHKQYDVILMDLQMPEMDGREASRQIRAEYQDMNTPWIIALTAGVLSEDRVSCMESGMNDYMAKPFRQGDLIAALHRAAERLLETASPKGVTQDHRGLAAASFLTEVSTSTPTTQRAE